LLADLLSASLCLVDNDSDRFIVQSIDVEHFLLDETVGGSLSSSSPPSPLLKKHTDLSLRKVRRHVLQLSQRWKSVNTNVHHRLKLLQRAQTVRSIVEFDNEHIAHVSFVKTVEDSRHKCDQVHGHLLDIELTVAHQPQIRSLTVEQVPAEIEQTKVKEQ
jgi:hypothetical protein